MNRLLVTSLFAFCLAITTVGADDHADLRQVFEEGYAAMKSAMAKRDVAALSSMLAPDFVSTDVSGQTENAAQMINELGKPPVDSRRISKTTIVTVKLKGGVAFVEQSYDMKTTKAAADGSVQNVELKTVSEDTWVKPSGVWLCESTTTYQLDYFINGEVVAHKTRQRPK